MVVGEEEELGDKDEHLLRAENVKSSLSLNWFLFARPPIDWLALASSRAQFGARRRRQRRRQSELDLGGWSRGLTMGTEELSRRLSRRPSPVVTVGAG